LRSSEARLCGVPRRASIFGVVLVLEAVEGGWLDVSEDIDMLSNGKLARTANADGSPDITFCTADCDRFAVDRGVGVDFCTLDVADDAGLKPWGNDGPDRSALVSETSHQITNNSHLLESCS
jgi:hypothetical protein